MRTCIFRIRSRNAKPSIPNINVAFKHDTLIFPSKWENTSNIILFPKVLKYSSRVKTHIIILVTLITLHTLPTFVIFLIDPSSIPLHIIIVSWCGVNENRRHQSKMVSRDTNYFHFIWKRSHVYHMRFTTPKHVTIHPLTAQGNVSCLRDQK